MCCANIRQNHLPALEPWCRYLRCHASFLAGGESFYIEAPANKSADQFIIQYVKLRNCLLVSNDTFRTCTRAYATRGGVGAESLRQNRLCRLVVSKFPLRAGLVCERRGTCERLAREQRDVLQLLCACREEHPPACARSLPHVPLLSYTRHTPQGGLGAGQAPVRQRALG
jgi:hypothetical protein